jgi:iron complex outermembrane receptor protein
MFDYFGTTFNPVDIKYYQYDVDGLHRFNWLDDRLKTIWGVNFRKSVTHSEEYYAGDPTQEDTLWRGFLHQGIRVREGLDLTLAVSLEHTDTGGTQPAYQAAAVISPWDRHTFRISYSLAPTVPNLFVERGNWQAENNVLIHGNPDMKSAKLQSYEVGYLGTYLKKTLEAQANLFYMRHKDVIRVFPTSFFPIVTLGFDNGNDAITRGAETKVTYRLGPGRSLYVNYTFENITDHIHNEQITKITPEHKVNVGALVDVGHGVSVTLNAGYKNSYKAITLAPPINSVDVPAYWRLDARVGYKPIPSLELFVAGQNLLDPRHVEYADYHEVSRTVYGGFLLEF